MSTPTIPRAMWSGGNLDVEAINDNLRGLQRSIRRNQDLRYSTTQFSIVLDGMADTDVLSMRSFLENALVTSQPYQIIAARASIYAPAGVVWTLTAPLATSWGGLTVTTLGTTTEAVAETSEPLPVSSTNEFTWTASGTNTITRGTITFTILVDRGQQGTASFVGYTPTLFSSTTGTAGSNLDTELTNAAAAVTQDTNAQSDLRLIAFTTRNLAKSASSFIVIPSGKRTGVGVGGITITAYAPAAATITGTINSTALGLTTVSVGGAGTTTFSSNTASFSGVDADDPAGAADDITITISRGNDADGNAAPLCYVLVWFS